MLAGRSGIRPVAGVDADDLPVRIAGQVPGFDPVAALGARAARHVDRFAQLAVVAAREALAQSKLDVAVAPHRVGVVVGTGVGGVRTYEREVAVLADRGPRRVSPYLSAAMIPNAAAAQVAMMAGARGPSSCPVTACATGTDAVGQAADMIRLGRADAVLAGGAEAAVTRAMIAGFGAMRALSTRNDEPAAASRPFSLDRDGFVMAEGAAVLVLEERAHALARGAPVLAEILGYGAASDAHHVTAPDPDGAGAMAAMAAALADAGLSAADVDYVNAHGTSTLLNDAVEARAIRAVLGDGVPVSSTKSMTGHLLGAAGALEAVVCVQALGAGVVPPTINHDEPDPECGLDVVPGVARTLPVEVVMSNSFGFGGHDACLLLGRA